MEFGNNFRRLRKDKGLTQEEMAECLDISPKTISKWENNISMPDISMLPVLADFFGITVDELLRHTASGRDRDMKSLSKQIHALVDAGRAAEAYEVLKSSMGKWALCASMNHLMSWLSYRLSKEMSGDERQLYLEEALVYADRVIRLDGGEPSKTAQAKMTKCFCMVDLGRRSEAVRIADSLPSMYSSRERVLAIVAEGREKQKNIDRALRYIEELKNEMMTIGIANQ